MQPTGEANCNYTGLMKLPEKAERKKHSQIRERKKQPKAKTERFTFLKLCLIPGNSWRPGHVLFTSLP